MGKADRFFESLKDKRIAFIGIGVSHFDLINMFLDKGLQVVVCDKKTSEQMGEAYDKLKEKGAYFSLGENYLDEIFKCDIVFRTPGMYYNHSELVKARALGIVVTSEMEVFFELCPCKIYAVTGSDGKTTTTTLISELLDKSGRVVHKGGNIGRALLPIIESINEDDAAVVELSSFQLISMRKSPYTAVITNISPNHLDVHGTMEEYVDAKKNIILHQNAFSKTILNLDNKPTNELSDLVRGRLVKFSRRTMPEIGAFVDANGFICYNEYGFTTQIMLASDIRLPGVHNVENYLAAISAVWGEVSNEVIVKVAREFSGVEHRIEFVREVDGVKWYNDSIATSPTRVLAGLNSFEQKLIVIAGGYDKKISFKPMSGTVNEKVKTLILLGVTADKIEKAITESDNYNSEKIKIYRVNSMEEAVQKAKEIAKPGDIVSLSPACASFDMYPNFEARGLHFKKLVNSL